MIKNIGIGDPGRLPASSGQQDRGLLLRPGSIVKAEVVDIAKDGNALLRIMSSGTGKGAMQGTIIHAFPEVPLVKGQKVYLEIIGGKDAVRMHIVGDMKNASSPVRQNIPVRLLDMLAKLSEARVGSSGFGDLLNALTSLPEKIRAAIPEFSGIEKLFMDIRRLDGDRLRAFVETSGVAFETKLKIAAVRDPKSVIRDLLALQADGDLKGILLRLKLLLKDPSAVQALKDAGLSASEVSSLAEKFIRNIEFFQMTSRVHDMFYAFLPALWEGVRDSEFMFRRGKEGKKDIYSCDINLDLVKLGRMSVSVTNMGKAFFVSFFLEQQDIADLFSSGKKLLEERFASQGLALKAVNISVKHDIPFGRSHGRGPDIRV